MPAGDGIKLNHVISGGVYLGMTPLRKMGRLSCEGSGAQLACLLRKSGSAAFFRQSRPGTLSRGGPLSDLFGVGAHQQVHDGLLGVEAVFRLVKDLLGVGLKDLRRDLLPTVGGQAVLYHAPRVGAGSQGGR